MEPRIIAGRYAVVRAIGRGGMGTVWLCRDEVLGREVAVKQVGNLPGETASDVHRALREARSSAALNHPHVVSIYDAVEDGDHNWLVMEYVPSRTLAEILEQEGSIAPERAAWIGAQAADGLAAAHARGTMHRDVKPSNILVTADDHVKITDFGIARTDGDAQLTSTGLITGTPAYFAPETATGAPPGLPADVWALGATLYAAVEGRPPYPDQGNALALLTTIATQAAPLPRRAGVLTEAVIRMMDRDPAARWTMADAAHVLRRVHEQGVTDESTARTTRTTRTTALPVPALATTGHEAAPTAAREQTRPDATGRRRAGLLPWVAVLLVAALAVVVGLLVGNDDGEQPTARDPGTGADTSGPATTPSSPAGSTTSDETEEPPPVETSPPDDQGEDDEKDDKKDKGKKGAKAVEEFGRDYYGLLPGDTASAYALLSPSYGSSYDEYDAFWSTIEGVEVRDVVAVDDTTVDVSITYLTADGGREDETRRLFLEPTDDGFAIVDDAAV